MNVVLFILSYIFTFAGALNIAFPSSPPAQTTFSVAWSRDKHDPNVQFYFQKIKLDDPDGPTAKSTPVPVANSDKNEGISPIFFNRAGIFEILAVNIQNGQPFYTTEVTVETNPTSTGGPPIPSIPTPAIPTDNNMNGGSNGPGGNSQGDSNGQSNGNSGFSSSAKEPPSSSSLGTISTTTASPSAMTSTTSTGPSADQASSSSDKKPSQPSSATVIGIVVGIIGFLFLIAVLVLFIRYRRRRQTHSFEQSMMVRSPGSVLPWTRIMSGSPTLNKDLESSTPPSLGPQMQLDDSSRAKIMYQPPLLATPPRSVISDTTVSSQSTTSSVRRTRDRNTPRLSTSTYTTTTSGSTSLRLFPVPALPPRTRTDRQMKIEVDIQALQSRMIYLQGRVDISSSNRAEREEELRRIHAKVDRLKQIHESNWALGLTDDLPPGMV